MHPHRYATAKALHDAIKVGLGEADALESLGEFERRQPQRLTPERWRNVADSEQVVE